MGSTCRESSQCVFDKCLTVDEWINLVNSSNVITKGKARLNRNSMLNGRDRHQQTLTVRGRLTVLYWRTGLHWGVGVGGGAGPAWPGGISSMITSTKSTHESVPFKHSVARLYIARLC